ncbi:MAG: hypothetical protein JWN00_3384 [Actinomycetia bacterium]|nr:hypothetical protein [Actinomycetes bacterium]
MGRNGRQGICKERLLYAADHTTASGESRKILGGMFLPLYVFLVC